MTSEPGQGAMIDITVKTLDGQNRVFSVPENLNVRQFKEKISSSTEIPADTQRLIFQGRVMQDDKMLKDYNVHDKVIHLVQRAPPSTVSGSTGSSPTITTSTPSTARPQIQLDGNLFDVQIHLGRLQSTPNAREARARIRQADFNLRLINEILSQFERLDTRPEDPSTHRTVSGHVGPAADSVSSMDTSSPPEASRTGQSEDREHPQQPWQTNSQSAEALGSDQHIGLTDLADFLDQLLDVNSRMITHVRRYQNLLRCEENYAENSREAFTAHEVVDRLNEVFHALSHMLHSLSDITVDMHTSVPRQAVALPPIPFQVPGTASMAIPIHMNFRARPDMNINRQRTSQSNSNLTPATDSRPTAASTGVAAASQHSAAVPSTNTATVPSTNTAAVASTNTAAVTSTTIPAGISAHQVPSLPLPLSQNSMTSGDSAFVVEVFPTSVTVHDITAVVTQGGMNMNSEASTESADGLGGNRANFASTFEHPLSAPAASATTTVTSTTASTQASTPNIQTMGASTFTTSSTSSTTFTFGPTTGVSFGGVTNLASGQFPNVPGLPPGMLQNILGSILSHEMQSGQPVQVNVVQQMTAAGPPSISVQQPVFDLPSDDRSRSQNQRHPLNQNITTSIPISTAQTASNVQANTVFAQVGTNTTSSGAASSVNVFTNTTSSGAASSVNASTNTSLSTNAATNTTSSASSNAFTSTFHLPNTASQSFTSSGTRTDPSMGTNSRSTNTPRPFPFHSGSQGLTRPQMAQNRLHQPGALRSMPGSRGYVDPYLPCGSPHYMSPTAVAALSALQEHRRTQQPHQQVPNLSTMVSGMVGEIIGQVGQASQQALNNSARASAAAAASQNSTSSVPGAASSITGQPPLNLNELLSQFMSVAGGTNQTGSFPPEVAPIIGGVLQAMSAAAISTNTTNRGSTATQSWTLADLFSEVRSASEDRAGESSVIISLLEAVAPHIGISDLFSLVMGGAQVLTRVRRPLQEFVTSLVSRHGSVEQVVEAALNDMRVDIQYLQGLVQVKDDVDMTQSVCNCLRAHLTTLFSTVHCDYAGPQENFGDHLYALWVKMLAESIALCVYCLHDGHAGFLSMLQNYVPRMTQGMSTVFTSWMTLALQSILGSFHSNHPVAESDITRYVVRKSQATTVSSDAQKQVSQTTATVASQSATSGTSPPVPKGTTKSPTLQSPKAKVPRTTLREDGATEKPYEDAQQAAQSLQPPAVPPSTLATQVQHTEAAEGGSKTRHGKGSDDWQSVVPQEWIPVISQDVVKQQEQRPQPPFSDAYLQGFPAKRRRMMTLEHGHEMGSMLHYLPESIQRAARTAGVELSSPEDTMVQEAANNLDLQAELEREVVSVLESRISSDQDYSSDQFPNAEEYFHKSTHH